MSPNHVQSTYIRLGSLKYKKKHRFIMYKEEQD